MPSQPLMLALFFQNSVQLLFNVAGQHHLRKMLPWVLDGEKFAQFTLRLRQRDRTSTQAGFLPGSGFVDEVAQLRSQLVVVTLRLLGRHLQGHRQEVRLLITCIGAKKCFELVRARHQKSPSDAW